MSDGYIVLNGLNVIDIYLVTAQIGFSLYSARIAQVATMVYCLQCTLSGDYISYC